MAEPRESGLHLSNPYQWAQGVQAWNQASAPQQNQRAQNVQPQAPAFYAQLPIDYRVQLVAQEILKKIYQPVVIRNPLISNSLHKDIKPQNIFFVEQPMQEKIEFFFTPPVIDPLDKLQKYKNQLTDKFLPLLSDQFKKEIQPQSSPKAAPLSAEDIARIKAEKEREEEAILDRLQCAITMDFIRDPIIDIYGHTYEKSVIMDWVRGHGTSPRTNRPLKLSDLKPYPQLLKEIEEYKKARNL